VIVTLATLAWPAYRLIAARAGRTALLALGAVLVGPAVAAVMLLPLAEAFDTSRGACAPAP
jgi:uncharacterized membrane protein YqjE